MHLAALLRGIFEGSDQKDWADILRMANAKIRLLDLNKAENKTLDKAEVSAAIQRSVSGFFFEFDRLCELELPPELKGLDEQQIKLCLVESLKKLKAAMSERLKSYMQPTAVVQNRS